MGEVVVLFFVSSFSFTTVFCNFTVLMIFLIVISLLLWELKNHCCVVGCCVWLFVSVLCLSSSKKAILGYMSHCATNWRNYCRFCVQRRPMHPLAGFCTLSARNSFQLVDLHIFLLHLCSNGIHSLHFLLSNNILGMEQVFFI